MKTVDDVAAVELLEAMVGLYSPSGQEASLAEFLVGWMREAGCCAWRDDAGNMVAACASRAPGRGRGEGVGEGLLLLGHMDTVKGFIPPRREGDRLYGRGAVDAKGPLAAFCVAAARAGASLASQVVVVGAVEEEAATSKGARALLGSFAPSAVVIGEPSGWDRVTVGYKGRLLVNLQLQGDISHTAGPGGGLCEAAVDFWQMIRHEAERWNEERRRLFDRLDPSLRSIHSSDDGFAERVEMVVGLRIPLGFDVKTLKAQLSAMADTLPRGQSATLSFRGQESPFRASKSTPLVRAFLQAIRSQGGQPRFSVKTGTSDMNVVGPAWHCPILAYGPGDSALDHTPQEHVLISEYLRSIRVLEEVLRELDSEAPDGG
jgi:LysW-gamma-L-lysine carboxypeptidase